MNGFWIVGIVLNLVIAVAFGVWAVRAWKQAGARREPPRSDEG